MPRASLGVPCLCGANQKLYNARQEWAQLRGIPKRCRRLPKLFRPNEFPQSSKVCARVRFSTAKEGSSYPMGTAQGRHRQDQTMRKAELVMSAPTALPSPRYFCGIPADLGGVTGLQPLHVLSRAPPHTRPRCLMAK